MVWVMERKRKRIRQLEKSLMKVFIDPSDSDQRRRYIKRWIYGEGVIPSKKNAANEGS